MYNYYFVQWEPPIRQTERRQRHRLVLNTAAGTQHFCRVFSPCFVNMVCVSHKIIMIVCCSLGICYGFQTMRICESPDTPFTQLYSRFETGGWFVNVTCRSPTISHLLFSLLYIFIYRLSVISHWSNQNCPNYFSCSLPFISRWSLSIIYQQFPCHISVI